MPYKFLHNLGHCCISDLTCYTSHHLSHYHTFSCHISVFSVCQTHQVHNHFRAFALVVWHLCLESSSPSFLYWQLLHLTQMFAQISSYFELQPVPFTYFPFSLPCCIFFHNTYHVPVYTFLTIIHLNIYKHTHTYIYIIYSLPISANYTISFMRAGFFFYNDMSQVPKTVSSTKQVND